ncbi:MAG: ATP-binding protein [Candidatus Polarisedimenticolaceae bacterium]|nr:ATP-binding protein [Candidatus Polarisedimenticolaceae bacterium]
MEDKNKWVKYRIVAYSLLLLAGIAFTGLLLFFAYHEGMEDERYQFIDQSNIVKDSFLNQLIGASTLLHSFHTVIVSSNNISRIHQAIADDAIQRMTFIEAAFNLPVVLHRDMAAFVTEKQSSDQPNFNIMVLDPVTQNLIPATAHDLHLHLPILSENLIKRGGNFTPGLDLASLPEMNSYIQQAIESGEVIFAPDKRPNKEASSYLAFLAVYSDKFISTKPTKRGRQVASIITLFINTATKPNSTEENSQLSFRLYVDAPQRGASSGSTIYQKKHNSLTQQSSIKTLTFHHPFHVNNQSLVLEVNKHLYQSDINPIGCILAIIFGSGLTICLLTLATIIGKHEQRLFNYNQLLLDKKAELLSREAHLKAILESAKDGILTINSKGIIQSCNSATLAIFGYRLDEMVGHNIAMIMPEEYARTHDTKIKDFITHNKTVTNGTGRLLEWPAVKKNGEVFPLELSTARIIVSEEIIFVGILRDISLRKQTEKKEQESKLEHARAEAEYHAKNSFFAMISHEMRTPLASVIGYAESLLDVNATKEHKISSIETIIRNSNHLLRIINEILELSKINSSDFQINAEPVSIISIIEDVKELITLQVKEKKLDFKINYHFPLPNEIEADTLRIKQILFNLLDNAVKFTDDGSITIEVSYDVNKKQLHIAVIDTGTGITEQQQVRIFGHYQQDDYLTSQKHGGTGLGLSIAQKLAQLHNGNIKVTSTLGKGSCFEFYMDVTHSETALLTALPQEFIDKNYCVPISIFKEKKLTGDILVAEDNPDMQGLISYYLKSLGASFTIVENGQQAVEAATERSYNLILMDMQMPIMNGIQAVKKLRDSGYQHPIVMLTANAMEKDRTTSLQMGCDEFLSKPTAVPLTFTAKPSD